SYRLSIFFEIRFGVALAEGSHLFPFRTEKLSPPAPMVLPGRPGGRVGRRPLNSRKRLASRRGAFRFLGVTLSMPTLEHPGRFRVVTECAPSPRDRWPG